jgi:hypothetical protein
MLIKISKWLRYFLLTICVAQRPQPTDGVFREVVTIAGAIVVVVGHFFLSVQPLICGHGDRDQQHGEGCGEGGEEPENVDCCVQVRVCSQRHTATLSTWQPIKV